MRSDDLLLDAIVRALEGEPVEAAPAEPPVVVLEEFLSRPDIERLVRWTLERRELFRPSQVINASGEGGVLDRRTRRSLLLSDVAPWDRVFAERIGAVLDHVLERLGMDRFEVLRSETQITATGAGEFFRAHTDNQHRTVSGRRLTYVYFYCREPLPFDGGLLRIYGTRTLADGRRVRTSAERIVRPSQNLIVFFPSYLTHEVSEVRCPAHTFEDGRVTVNGWLHAGRPIS
jgi:hypothetical protein